MSKMSLSRRQKRRPNDYFCEGWEYSQIKSMVWSHVGRWHRRLRDDESVNDITSLVIETMLSEKIVDEDIIWRVINRHCRRAVRRSEKEVLATDLVSDGSGYSSEELFDTFSAQREKCKPQQENVIFWKQCASAALGIDDDLLSLIADFANPVDFAKELNMPLPQALARYRRFCERMREKVSRE